MKIMHLLYLQHHLMQLRIINCQFNPLPNPVLLTTLLTGDAVSQAADKEPPPPHQQLRG